MSHEETQLAPSHCALVFKNIFLGFETESTRVEGSNVRCHTNFSSGSHRWNKTPFLCHMSEFIKVYNCTCTL